MLGPRAITLETLRVDNLYDAVVSGSDLPASPSPLSVECIIPRRLVQWYPHSLTVAANNAAAVGTAVPALSLLVSFTRCRVLVRVRPSCDYV